MGYISGDGKDGYRLSRKLLKLAYQATAGSLVERALPVMRELAAACRETVLLGAAAFAFRLHGQGQAQGLPVG
jgi:DNA-binding IclR family transcriptional regulator